MSEVKRYEVIADKYGDGTVEPSDAGSVVFYEDYAALKAGRDALAAENANLKHLLSMIAETGNANFGRTTLYTPATDAYLNTVRAEGADKVAEYHFVRVDALKEVSRQGHLFHKAAYSDAVNVANLFRASKDGD